MRSTTRSSCAGRRGSRAWRPSRCSQARQRVIPRARGVTSRWTLLDVARGSALHAPRSRANELAVRFQPLRTRCRCCAAHAGARAPGRPVRDSARWCSPRPRRCATGRRGAPFARAPRPCPDSASSCGRMSPRPCSAAARSGHGPSEDGAVKRRTSCRSRGDSCERTAGGGRPRRSHPRRTRRGARGGNRRRSVARTCVDARASAGFIDAGRRSLIAQVVASLRRRETERPGCWVGRRSCWRANIAVDERCSCACVRRAERGRLRRAAGYYTTWPCPASERRTAGLPSDVLRRSMRRSRSFPPPSNRCSWNCAARASRLSGAARHA